MLRVGQRYEAAGSDGIITSDAGISSATEAEGWLRQFEMVSRTNWRVDKTYPDTHIKLIFKVHMCLIYNVELTAVCGGKRICIFGDTLSEPTTSYKLIIACCKL